MRDIAELLDRLPTLEGFCSGAPAPDEAIAVLEEAFGVKLPPSYVAFLERFGWAESDISDGVTIAGVHDGDPYDPTASVLHNTRRYRERWGLPGSLLVIQPDEDAPYCFDTGGAEADGEYPVVCYELSHQRSGRIAANFSEWLDDFVLYVEDDED